MCKENDVKNYLRDNWPRLTFIAAWIITALLAVFASPEVWKIVWIVAAFLGFVVIMLQKLTEDC